MTPTQLRVVLVAVLTVAGLYLCMTYVMPLGARVLPAILLVGWMYLITRPIAAAWRELGPHPVIVAGTFAFRAVVVVWMLAAVAIAYRSISAGVSPIPVNRQMTGALFLWVTAPFWWGFACALAMLYRRAR